MMKMLLTTMILMKVFINIIVIIIIIIIIVNDVSIITAGNYKDMETLVTTEPPDPDELELAMEEDFSLEDNTEDYYFQMQDTSNTTDWQSEQAETTVLTEPPTDGRTSGEPTISYLDYDVTPTEEHSIIEDIIEQARKSEAEKLLETVESSKVLEKILQQSDKDTILEEILPREEESDRDSLLSKILRIFRK